MRPPRAATERARRGAICRARRRARPRTAPTPRPRATSGATPRPRAPSTRAAAPPRRPPRATRAARPSPPRPRSRTRATARGPRAIPRQPPASCAQAACSCSPGQPPNCSLSLPSPGCPGARRDLSHRPQFLLIIQQPRTAAPQLPAWMGAIMRILFKKKVRGDSVECFELAVLNSFLIHVIHRTPHYTHI